MNFFNSRLTLPHIALEFVLNIYLMILSLVIEKIQCFRHTHDKAIAERSSYTEAQKKFFIDYELTIINAIHSLTLEN